MDTEPAVPRRPGDIRNTPSHGIPKATPREGTPVPSGAPNRPIVHHAHGGNAPPSAWGPPPGRRPAEQSTGGPYAPGPEDWADVPEAQAAHGEREEPASTTGPMGIRETSGIQVRLGSRDRERERRARRRAGRRNGLVAAGVLVLAGLVTIGVVLTGGAGDGEEPAPAQAGGAQQRPAGADLPPAGDPVTVATADGSTYRIAAVDGGVGDGVTTSFSPSSGTSFAYIEYVLSNPSGEKALLDFPGDVFVKRDLVVAEARERCMPQAGVPEDMCTPPTKSQVVRRLAGDELVPGEGGDRYLPPGASYLVRATVDVPVKRTIERSEMRLYVWKQLYVADQLAKHAPFPD